MPRSWRRSCRHHPRASACDPSACSTAGSPAACGRRAARRTARSRSPMERRNWTGSATWSTSSWPPGRAAPTGVATTMEARPRRSWIRTSTSGSRRSAGSSPRRPTRRSRRWRSRCIETHRASPAVRWLPRHVLPGGPSRRWSSPTWSGATSCTWPDTSCRRPSPGSGASMTTGSCASRSGSSAASSASWGPDGGNCVCGHPELEMALVELYRTTGQDRYLELARVLVERRGHGLLGEGPLRRPLLAGPRARAHGTEPVGHAVRQVYLDCGVVDVAIETGDQELLESAIRRWDALRASRMYLTGALGSRHQGEAIGAAFELPPDRAYAETCASIGSAMLAWRLLLATGEARFADVIERTAYNGILAGLGSDGSHFFYSNPLQRRSAGLEILEGAASTRRAGWFEVSCCPPNLMRFLATFPDQVATVDRGGIRIHQFATGSIEATVGGGDVKVEVSTAYPWTGEVELDGRAEPSRSLDALDPGPGVVSGRHAEPGWFRRPGPGGTGHARSDAPLGGRGPSLAAPRDGAADHLRGPSHRRRPSGCRAGAGPACVRCRGRRPAGWQLGRVARGRPGDRGPCRHRDGARDRGGDAAGVRGAGPRRSRGHRMAVRQPKAGTPRKRGVGGPRSRSSAVPYFAWAERPGLGMRVWLPTRPRTMDEE